MKMIEKTQTDVVKERVQRAESLPEERDEALGFDLVRGLVCMMTDDENPFWGVFLPLRIREGPTSRYLTRGNRIG
jgi:hypothetical protein